MDPACSGCGAEILYEDVANIERFIGPHMETDYGIEALVLQLDVIQAAHDWKELQRATAW